MFAGVTLVIFWAFHSGYGTSRPHAEAQVLAVFWGAISALAWGLSVVGTLVWEDFGIVSGALGALDPRFRGGDGRRGYRSHPFGAHHSGINQRRAPAAFSRRPRESGGPGLQAPCPPPPVPARGKLWMPACAGMTVKWVGAER
jgi:hypothetical protein